MCRRPRRPRRRPRRPRRAGPRPARPPAAADDDEGGACCTPGDAERARVPAVGERDTFERMKVKTSDKPSEFYCTMAFIALALALLLGTQFGRRSYEVATGEERTGLSAVQKPTLWDFMVRLYAGSAWVPATTIVACGFVGPYVKLAILAYLAWRRARSDGQPTDGALEFSLRNTGFLKFIAVWVIALTMLMLKTPVDWPIIAEVRWGIVLMHVSLSVVQLLTNYTHDRVRARVAAADARRAPPRAPGSSRHLSRRNPEFDAPTSATTCRPRRRVPRRARARGRPSAARAARPGSRRRAGCSARTATATSAAASRAGAASRCASSRQCS